MFPRSCSCSNLNVTSSISILFFLTWRLVAVEPGHPGSTRRSPIGSKLDRSPAPNEVDPVIGNPWKSHLIIIPILELIIICLTLYNPTGCDGPLNTALFIFIIQKLWHWKAIFKKVQSCILLVKIFINSFQPINQVYW